MHYILFLYMVRYHYIYILSKYVLLVVIVLLSCKFCFKPSKMKKKIIFIFMNHYIRLYVLNMSPSVITGGPFLCWATPLYVLFWCKIKWIVKSRCLCTLWLNSFYNIGLLQFSTLCIWLNELIRLHSQLAYYVS